MTNKMIIILKYKEWFKGIIFILKLFLIKKIVCKVFTLTGKCLSYNINRKKYKYVSTVALSYGKKYVQEKNKTE